jgi:hypothetical protein
MRFVTAAALSGILLVFSAGSLNAQHGGQPNLPCDEDCGGGGPFIYIGHNGFSAANRPPESGPYTYTISLVNLGNEAGITEIGCTTEVLPCGWDRPVQPHDRRAADGA